MRLQQDNADRTTQVDYVNMITSNFITLNFVISSRNSW